MIVGCYVLHLYCDAPEGSCANGWHEENTDEFTGETASEARRWARDGGWTLDMHAGKALCPSCKKLGRRLSKEPTP